MRLRDWESIAGFGTSSSCCQQHIKSLSTYYYSIRYEVLYIFCSSAVVVLFHETSFQDFLALPDEMQRWFKHSYRVHVCACIDVYACKYTCSIYGFIHIDTYFHVANFTPLKDQFLLNKNTNQLNFKALATACWKVVSCLPSQFPLPHFSHKQNNKFSIRVIITSSEVSAAPVCQLFISSTRSLNLCAS